MTAGIGLQIVSLGDVDYKKIRSVSVVIRDDADSSYYTPDSHSAIGVNDLDIRLSTLGVSLVNTNISGGLYGNSSFDATGYNRGWVTIIYES
jgi:hypothetical protein